MSAETFSFEAFEEFLDKNENYSNFNTKWINFVFFSGIITSTGGCMVGERLSSSGTRLNVTTSSPVQSAGPINSSSSRDVVKSSADSVHRGLKSVSRQSLLGETWGHISLLRRLTQIQLVILLLEMFWYKSE